MPISSYSLSLRLLDVSQYWDPDVIADEWHMYIKAFFSNDARLRLEPIFLPFVAHATSGKTFLQGAINRYLQTLRHAWGSKEVGYIIIKMLDNSTVPLNKTFYLLLRVSHDLFLSSTGWVIITFGVMLPLVFHQALRRSSIEFEWRDPILLVLQISLIVMFIVGVAVWYQDVRVRPMRRTNISLRYIMLTLLGFFLLHLACLLNIDLLNLN